FVRQQLQSNTFLQRIAQEFQLAAPGATDTEGIIEAVRGRTELNPLTPNAFRLAFKASDPNLAQAVTRRLAERVIQLNDSFRKEKVYGTDQFLDDQLRQAAEHLNSLEEKLSTFYAQHFPGIPREVQNFDSVGDLQRQLAGVDTTLRNL